jgi:hypothetical protein
MLVGGQLAGVQYCTEHLLNSLLFVLHACETQPVFSITNTGQVWYALFSAELDNLNAYVMITNYLQAF